jgi:nucleotide-binding universal stress UspA family protein
MLGNASVGRRRGVSDRTVSFNMKRASCANSGNCNDPPVRRRGTVRAPCVAEVYMIAIKHILVATDFSEPSGVALSYGRDLARAYDATLHVVHVVQDLIALHGDQIGFATADVERSIEAAAGRELDAAITDNDRDSLNVRTMIRRSPNVAHAITEYAKDNAIDLIIVGTHGRGALQRFLIGSVAERVMRTAPCPVLTVRTPGRDFIDTPADGVANTGQIEQQV